MKFLIYIYSIKMLLGSLYTVLKYCTVQPIFIRLKSDFLCQKDFSNLVELVYNGSVELTKESVESLLQLTKVRHSNIRIENRGLKFSQETWIRKGFTEPFLLLK